MKKDFYSKLTRLIEKETSRPKKERATRSRYMADILALVAKELKCKHLCLECDQMLLK